MTYADDLRALLAQAQDQTTNTYIDGLLASLTSDLTAHADALSLALTSTQDTLAATEATLAEVRASLAAVTAGRDAAVATSVALQADKAALTSRVATLEWQVELLQARIAELESPVSPDVAYRPISFVDLPTAVAALGLPADAQYVVWNHGNQHLEQVFPTLTADTILVLPERPTPYLIDSSSGFMAAGVASIDGTGPDGKKDGSRVPIVSRAGLWFAMTRARRGVLGLGPGVVIQPSESTFTAPRQPILQDEPSGVQNYYTPSGQAFPMVGAGMKLMESAHANPIFANFTMKSRSFDGVAYSSLYMDGAGLKTVKRVHFDGSWRGHAGIPNGETGAIALSKGTYLIEHCDMRSVNGTSPIMWNQTTGGTVRHVRSTRPEFGMFTFWRCGGLNVFEDVYTNSRQTGMNIEENKAGFELRWTRGLMTLDFSGNKFHFSINPSGGYPKITMTDVTMSTNGYTGGHMTANIYGTSSGKRSWVTSNTLPASHVPASKWVD